MRRPEARAARRPVRGLDADREYVFGVHSVSEAIAAGEPLLRLTVGRRRAADKDIAVLLQTAAARGIRVDIEDEAAFRRYGDAHHQHIVALAPPFGYTEWAAVRAAVRADENALVVALDHIEDPQNVGAILRNAECAGATAAVLPDRRSALVTAGVRRAAAGAASHLPIARVPNIVRAFADLKEDGCWVVGTATAPQAVPYTAVDYTGRCVLVVGAEAKGLSHLALQRCDILAKIPMKGKIASLNASSAAAVVLFEAVRQRAAKALVTTSTSGQTPVNP
ncbi:MAG TPA: 23S rRNA (guanosine(2251)-2'-O)-methyltransferase RlmB [Candidatus Eremiobacteraceae bacterium]